MGSKGPLRVGRENCSASRKRALLKRFCESPWRTKPLSNSQRIIFTLCDCLLWIFNALPLFITKGFHVAARLKSWFARGGGGRGGGAPVLVYFGTFVSDEHRDLSPQGC